MADTLLRSPDGTRERWCNEKEVAHLTSKSDPIDRWTIVITDEKPPRDPHDVIEEPVVEADPVGIAVAPADEPLAEVELEKAPIQRPKPKPLPKPKKGKGR
jgi:hypothetical protein